MTVEVTLEQARAWVDISATNITDEQLELILGAEIETQARACRIDPIVRQSGLEQAILRRVGRATASRALPTGLVGDPTLAVSRLPSYDAEIERYERPYRLMVFG